MGNIIILYILKVNTGEKLFARILDSASSTKQLEDQISRTTFYLLRTRFGKVH